MSLLDRATNFVHTKTQNTVLSILSAGPVPRHVAFVMDGNRRHARQHQKEIREGHAAGFLALRRTLEICLRLGVHCVTVFAFAIPNFKRSAKEVDDIMHLAEEKLIELCQHEDLLLTYGVKLNIIGKTELLPPFVQAAIEKAEGMTRHNTKAILNICMPYTSSHEITSAVESTVRDALEAGPQFEITEEVIEARLMTSKVGSPPLDILVRTSGVKRLSDFMLWQCCEDTQIHLSAPYWPDFSLKEVVPIVLDYQRKVWATQAKAKADVQL